MFKAIGIIILIGLQHFSLFGSLQKSILSNYQLDRPVLSEYHDKSNFPFDPAIPPQQKSKTVLSGIKAKSIIVMDLKSSEIIYTKDADKKRRIASITKLMTALVVLDKKGLNDKVIVSKSDTRTSGTKMWLYQGEEITVANLLKGLLINSAADAAQTLARTTSGNYKRFVEAMNAKALELGLENTHFGDPVGLNDVENYSTTKDLAELTKVTLQNKFIRNVVKIKSTSVKSTDGNLAHPLENTNELLDSDLNIKGVKTGYTKKAGGCLVALAQSGKAQIIVIVLNSPSRFTETERVINWVFKNYQW